MRIDHHHFIHYTGNPLLERIMASITELNTKVDQLQATVDAEQEQIAAAIQGLKDQIAALEAQVATGATPEALQAVIDKLSVMQADLEGTVQP